MANKKEDMPVIVLTEQQKEIIERVKTVVGSNTIDLSKLKLHKDSADDYYSVLYDCMGTGIHIPQKDIDESEFTKNGITIWRTWTFEC